MKVSFQDMTIDMTSDSWMFISTVKIERLATICGDTMIVQKAAVQKLQSGKYMGNYSICEDFIVCRINNNGNANFKREVLRAFDQWKEVKTQLFGLLEDTRLLEKMATWVATKREVDNASTKGET